MICVLGWLSLSSWFRFVVGSRLGWFVLVWSLWFGLGGLLWLWF